MKFRSHIVLALLLGTLSTKLYAQERVEVEISGISGELANNVRLFLSIEQQRNHSLLSEVRLRRLHARATQEITYALQPYGYYRPEITAHIQQTGQQQWLASYTIHPGPPLPIKEMDIVLLGEMGSDAEFLRLVAELPLQPGGSFNHLHYKTLKSGLTKLAAERGYLDAHFREHRVDIDLEAYEARLHLHYDGGPRYRFGEVSLQQDVLDEPFLKRYIPFAYGDAYTLAALNELQQALNDSDYFQSVEITTAPAQTESATLPVNVSLSPRKRHRYSMGLGYGTDTGLRTKFGWDISRLNRSGHRFGAEAKVSEIGHTLSTQYRVPVLNPRTDQMIYSAAEINEVTDVSDSTVRTLGVSLNRSNGLWREALSLNYQQESFVIADDSGYSRLFIPSANWSRIWGRNVIYTLDGLRLDLGIRGSTTELLSDTDFLQAQASIKGINPLGRQNRIILRGTLGATLAPEFRQLPSSVRFFAGGGQSVRGYAYQSLGPLDANGKVVGGKHLMFGSMEFEHSLNGFWGLALFYEGGNAFDDFSEKLAQGAGLGLRWKSPIGPIRIDLASAITQKDQPWRLHINIGPDL